MKKALRVWAAVAALALLCAGCSLDVESFLRPPRAQGEQQAVQTALETYIRDSGGAAARYTLKYPTEGAHTAAFVLCDEKGNPLEDDDAVAQMAVAFYALSSAPEETHVNLLRRDGEDWVSVADRVGSGADILQVAFGDLNADGAAELLTGWSTYNSRDHRLAVYDTAGELRLLSDDRLYTELYVGDLTATGRDSLLLLHVGSGNTVTAALEELNSTGLRTVDTVALDGFIQQFGGMTLCRLAEGVHGLYVDALKSGDTMITELIYYDHAGLHAPFYDFAANVTTVTGRANRLAARDVDGDAMVEIPLSQPLAGHEAGEIGGALTVWRVWDYTTGSWSDRLHTLVNAADNYLVILDQGRREHLDTVYDTERRILDLLDTSTDRVWLRLTIGDAPLQAPAAGMVSLTLFDATENTPGCLAWFDPMVLEAEKVRYMVFRLTEEGG